MRSPGVLQVPGVAQGVQGGSRTGQPKTKIKLGSRGSAVHFTGRGLPAPGFEPELGGTPEHPEGIWGVRGFLRGPLRCSSGPERPGAVQVPISWAAKKTHGKGLPAPAYSAPTKGIP